MNTTSTSSHLGPDTPFCRERKQQYDSIPRDGKTFLIAIFSLFCVAGILLNSFVILIIAKTKQYQNQSIKLIMLLSGVDLFNSLTNVLHVGLLLWFRKVSCIATVLFYFISLLAIYSSAFVVSLVGLDRYLRVLYLNDYQTKFTTFRFHLAICACAFLVIWQSGFSTFSNAQAHYGSGAAYTLPVNAMIVLCITTMYLLSIFKLKGHHKENRSLSTSTRNIVRLATVYFYLYIICQGFMVVYHFFLNVLRRDFGKSVGPFLAVFIYIIPSLAGTVNAIAFLLINRKAKSFVFRLLTSVNPQSA